MNSAFNEKESKQYAIHTCVISKNDIWINSNQIPVISLDAFINIYKSENGCLKKIINGLENRTYLPQIQQGFKYSIQSIEYAGYTFNVPAYSYEQDDK
jgi:hypothetical protein